MHIFKLSRWKAPKPSHCPQCYKDDELMWEKGEWKCARCRRIIEPD
ncbi:hypothetical protein [Shimazuella alba]|uniref:Uncharacterized protein n=1 Tax=Shimazuella alba TaxID=2690964 RepID=A0A6I4VXZ9_9BACL|nr:hypothetical protein [Shimazuella alba]MXQ54845.1 hypothetical protein [Shimazuella alba]